jgi:SOUL heme-binding protein
MATEEPKFEVVTKDGAFEVRQYAPMVVAETFVDGSQDDASSRGFRVIAGYIFGDNKRAGQSAEKIAMTAPVTIEKQDASQKLSMTAPVTLEQQGGRWRVQFVMPSQYKLSDLPKPNNASVTLREVPGRKVAALRFSGFAGEEKVAEKTAELREWLVARGLTAAGSGQLARYDPPWTLAFLRRNEIILELR